MSEFRRHLFDNQALICAQTAGVDLPYRSWSVGNAPALKNASGNANCLNVGVTPLRSNQSVTPTIMFGVVQYPQHNDLQLILSWR